MAYHIERSSFINSRLSVLKAISASAIVLLVLAAFICSGCGRSGSETATTAADGNSAANETASAPEAGKPGTMQEVAEVRELLKSMAAAYAKASSYQDAAEVEMRAVVDGKPFAEKGDYSLTFQRPNRLRMHVYQGTAVCDGQNLLAWVAGIPNQVLKVPAPAALGIDTIFADNVLADSMANGPTQQFAWAPLQMLLLCGKDPLNTLLFQAKETRLLEPAEIDGRKCRRVAVRRDDGTCVFWIDDKSLVLRRFEFPVAQLSGMAGPNKVEVQSLTAEFHAAEFDQPIDSKAFAAELPPGAETVDELAPIAVQMLGKQSADFIFVGLDNKPLTLKSLEGRAAVIEFWSAASLPSRDALAQIEKVAQKFKDNPQTAFLAVSIDRNEVANEQLAQVQKEMGLTLPFYRISQEDADRAFKIRGIPTTVILDPKGRIQDYQAGMTPDAAAVISQEVELILAGKDIAAETLHAFETIKLRYAEIFQAMTSQNLYVNPAVIVQQMSVAKRSNPQRLVLRTLWARPELADSGGILVVPPDAGGAGTAGRAKIFVVHGGRSVAVLDHGGNITADHDLKLPEQEYVSRLRTCKNKDGKRLFLAMSPGMQQLHLFDENWQSLMSFPKDAKDNPHAGVGDACLADLDGDGNPEIAAGYLGLVGVKGISLAGEQLWSNRTIANVFSLAVGAPDGSGRRPVYCVNDRAALAAVDAKGKIQQELALDGRLLFAIAAQDLDGGPEVELCGLSAPNLGENLALGLGPQGNLLWSYQMPKGTFAETIERICGARLSANGPGQWILLGPDGSIHFVGIDGKPIDQFNYGSAVTGIACGELNGQPVLLIGSRQGIEALAVEWPAEKGK